MDQLHDAGEVLQEKSEPFVGQWQRLVSTTNWEKGRIIQQWRDALIAADAPSTDYSDEAWSNLVGGVTPQHVGRLRRTCVRFGEAREGFEGLYWSHFHAAVDWEDAEMWLEGAVQSRWSVAQMRAQHAEAVGAAETSKAGDEDVIAGVVDEDFGDVVQGAISSELPSRVEQVDDLNRPTPEGPDFGDEEPTAKASAPEPPAESTTEVAPAQPFANLAALPDDVTEAFEAFKLAILRHRADGWKQIGRDELTAVLDSLKELALAPTGEESAPF